MPFSQKYCEFSLSVAQTINYVMVMTEPFQRRYERKCSFSNLKKTAKADMSPMGVLDFNSKRVS